MEVRKFIQYALNYEVASAERMNGEYMVIDFEIGNYFSVCDFGADIISLIAARVDSNAWERILLREWKIEPSVKLQEEIERFLNVLKNKNLIFEIDTFDREDFQLPQDMDRTVFRLTPISTFEDMANLLMVDPIHDSSLMGWPNKEIVD